MTPLLVFLLLQATPAEPVSPAPTEITEPAPAAAEQPAAHPPMRCELRAPTGRRLRVRVCEPVETNTRDEAAADVVRELQRTRYGADDSILGPPPSPQ